MCMENKGCHCLLLLSSLFFFKQGVSLTLYLLKHHPHLLCHHTPGYKPFPDLIWALGIQTQVPILPQQTLRTLSTPPAPTQMVLVLNSFYLAGQDVLAMGLYSALYGSFPLLHSGLPSISPDLILLFHC